MASWKSLLQCTMVLAIFGHVSTFSTPPEPIAPLRLVGDDTGSKGRVEVLYNNSWWTVCADEWDVLDAGVVCKQLEYTAGYSLPLTTRTTGAGRGPDYAYPSDTTSNVMDKVACDGSENALSLCKFAGWYQASYCRYSHHAGVACNLDSDDLNLVNGTERGSYTSFTLGGSKDNAEGVLVATSYLPKAGLVPSGGVCTMNSAAADVYCRNVGFFYGGEPTSVSRPDTFPMIISNIECDEYDSYLTYCNLEYTRNGHCPRGVQSNGIKCYTTLRPRQIAGLAIAAIGSVIILIGGMCAVWYVTFKRTKSMDANRPDYSFTVANE